MSSTIRIARRFCGPPNSGNGGYSAGILASLLAGPCECTLRKPIPLERELQTEVSDSAARLVDGVELIIEAEKAQIGTTKQAGIPFNHAERAAADSAAFHNHPFPTCFTFVPDRSQ